MDIGIQLSISEWDADFVYWEIHANSGKYQATAACYSSHALPQELTTALTGFPITTSDVKEIMIGTFDPKFAEDGVKLRFTLNNVRCWVQSKQYSASAEFTIHVEAWAIDEFVLQCKNCSIEKDKLLFLSGS